MSQQRGRKPIAEARVVIPCTLEVPQAEAVRALAARWGVPVVQVIRRAIADMIKADRKAGINVPLS